MTEKFNKEKMKEEDIDKSLEESEKMNRNREEIRNESVYLSIASGTQGIQQDVVVDDVSLLQPVSCGGFGVCHCRRKLGTIPLHIICFLHFIQRGAHGSGGWSCTAAA